MFHLKQLMGHYGSDPAEAFIHALNIVKPILESKLPNCAHQNSRKGTNLYKCGVGLKDDLNILNRYDPTLQPR